MNKLIIMFGCKKQVGKDTISDYLVRNHAFVKIPIARQLKLSAMNVFGLTHAEVYDEELKDQLLERFPKKGGSFWTPREILQKYGMDVCAIDRDVWTRKVFERIKKENYMCGNSRFVISDTRLLDELEYGQSFCDENNFELIRIRINRVAAPRSESGHITETGLDHYLGWDLTFDNNGTVEEFCKNVEITLDSIGAIHV